jgi:hypothetical protein
MLHVTSEIGARAPLLLFPNKLTTNQSSEIQTVFKFFENTLGLV